MTTFEQFKESVERSGLVAMQCTDFHWQILGGKYLVNYYPLAYGGPTMYVAGMAKRAPKRALVQDAIRAAGVGYALRLSTKRKMNYGKFKQRCWARSPNCYYCGKPLGLDEATVDHRIPLARGGLDNANNRVIACLACNQSKGCLMPHKVAEARQA